MGVLQSSCVVTAEAAPPPAALAVLSESDFPDGGAVASETAAALPVFAAIPRSSAYTRTFSSPVFRGEDLVTVNSSAVVVKHVSDVTKFMSALAHLTTSASAKNGVIKQFEKEFSSANATVVSARMVRARVLRFPNQAVDFAVAMKYSTGVTLNVGELWVGEGSTLSFTVYLAKVFTAGDSVGLAQAVDRHIQIASATVPPTNGAPPGVSGTPQVSQTVSAVLGTWTGKAEMEIQWLRCSPTGSQCIAISGATAPTYLVVAGDVGSTLEVDVTATNGAGTTSAESAPSTAVV